MDEVVFRIQGIVMKNELVPKGANNCSTRKAIYLSQYVEICGINTATFEACIANILDVHQKFGQHLAGTPMCDLVTRLSADGVVFSAGNRLFTRRSEAPTEQDNSFEPGVDPVQRFAKLKGTELIHAPENMVKYYRLKGNAQWVNNHDKYQTIAPGTFQPGDIVEMQVAFIAIMSEKKITITKRLQALTLLDDSYTKVRRYQALQPCI
ncbi:hypothetical protein C8R44DRAFT_900920 [Mycena epipterygia]|nr:hypothetical protein C8R44DRAFT_900920 [Mycena epipterygia]